MAVRALLDTFFYEAVTGFFSFDTFTPPGRKGKGKIQKRPLQIRWRNPRTFVLIAGQFFGAVREFF